VEFTGFASLPETTRPPRGSRNASTSRSCQNWRVAILIGLFHPVLDTKGTAGLVARREKFAGAAAKMVSPLRSMTPHRIDALRTTGHTAKQPPEIAHEFAPARRIQTQPGQDGRQAARGAAPFARNNLPGRPVKQFQIIFDRHRLRQESLITAPLARFTRTGRSGRMTRRSTTETENDRVSRASTMASSNRRLRSRSVHQRRPRWSPGSTFRSFAAPMCDRSFRAFPPSRPGSNSNPPRPHTPAARLHRLTGWLCVDPEKSDRFPAPRGWPAWPRVGTEVASTN